MTLRARRQLATAVYVALAIALLLCAVREHEPWRDETQALLIARNVPLSGWLRALRFEIHPPLLFALFKISDGLFPPPYGLFAVGALGFYVLLQGTDDFITSFASLPWAPFFMTLALAFTSTYSYVLGIVVRGYGLGLGLSLLAVARLHSSFAAPRARLVPAAIFAALAASTSMVSAVFVLAVAFAFVVCFVMARRPILHLSPLTFLAAPTLFAYWLSRPFDERTYNHAYVALDTKAIAERIGSLTKTSLDYRHWWTVPGDPKAADFAWHCLAIGMAIALVFGIVRVLRSPARELFPILAFAASSAAIGYLVLFRFQHPELHHTVYAVFPPILLCLAWLVGADKGRVVSTLAAGALLLFGPWFVEQYIVAKANLVLDRDNEFSHTRVEAGLLPSGARLVSSVDYRATSISYFRPDVAMRSPNMSGAYYTYVEWSKAQGERVPGEPLVVQECNVARDKVFTLGQVAPPQCTTLAAPVYKGVTAATGEYENLFHVDCDCVDKSK